MTRRTKSKEVVHMATSVQITFIICASLVLICMIGNRKK